MNKSDIKILAIESSCDETAAAVIGVENGHPVVLSSIISSQADLHAKTGGVVPEVASRAHMEAIMPVIAEAIQAASTEHSEGNIPNKEIDYKATREYLKSNITHIAVTNGPGLIGSLLVGYNAAKTIAYALDKPIIPVNHIEGHIYSAFSREIRNSKSEIPNKNVIPAKAGIQSISMDSRVKPENDRSIEFPLVSLTVSGGHTSLTLMTDHGKYENLGSTLDDAAGEAFDKVAKLMDLGYPGGPIISKLASQLRTASSVQQSAYSKEKIVFPRPILHDGTFNFSYSGLKTAVLQKVRDLTNDGEIELSEETKQQVAAAFEDAAVDVLVVKSLRACEKYHPKTFVLAGGVAANKFLREQLTIKLNEKFPEIKLIIPPFSLCGDNAAMIGTAAFYHIFRDNMTTWDKTEVDSGLEL